MRSNQSPSFLYALGIVVLSLGRSPVPVAGQERFPMPEGAIQEVDSFAQHGEAWLKSKGWYENYDQIRKDFKIPFVSVARPEVRGSHARFHQRVSENLVQVLSLCISASRVRELRAQGIDVVDTFLRKQLISNNIWVPLLRTEVVVGGRIIGGVERPGKRDQWAALLVVTEVYRGEVAIGDTLHLIMAGGPHDVLVMGKSGFKVEPWHSNVIFGLAQKSFPLFSGYGIRDSEELRGKEYVEQAYYRVSGEEVTGVDGVEAGIRMGKKQDFRDVIKTIYGRK